MARMFAGRIISKTAPTSGQVMTWNATTGEWTPTTASSSPGGTHAGTHATGQEDALAPSAIGAASVSALEGHTGNSNNPHSTTAGQVGAATTGALTAHTGATAPHTGHAASTHTHTPAEASALAATLKGAANGVAELGVDGKVPAAQLPPSSGSTPAWHGKVYGAWGGCDPNDLLQIVQCNPINATPTNITIIVARCACFKPPANIVVNKIRAFGVGATTNVYRVAIYRKSDMARLTAELAFSTSAQAWVAIGSGLNLTLVAGELYFVAVSVNAVGTTAGLLCIGATTGRIGVLGTAWPGNLDVDMSSPSVDPFCFCQFAVTTGALPATAPALAARAAWTGGMPAMFLDNNNA